MINEVFFLNGPNFFGDALFRLSNMGLFDYILPMILIFALVYGILLKTKAFQENKSVNAIIAIAVSLMALQFNMVSEFFSEIFPRAAIGLSVILVLIILLGIFLPEEKWVMYVLLGVTGVIFLIVLLNTSQNLGWSSGYWWSSNWEYVAVAIFILVLFGLVVSGGSGESGPSDPKKNASLFFKSLFGN